MNKEKSYAIIGGGIGGLTLAIAMQQKGFRVKVYEGAPVIKPLGAGLGLAANAVKAFSELELSDEVLRVGKVIKRIAIKDYKGRVLTETDSEKLSQKLGVINSFTIHRADLHDVLLKHVAPETLSLGKNCVDFQQRSTGVSLFFDDGTSAEADYVIAGDGIHSVFRKKLMPGTSPRFAGYTCWRAVIDDIPPGFNMNETSETWGPGCRFGIVPLSRGRVYWFACINSEANNSVMKQFTIADLLKHFGKFHTPVLEILNRTKNEQLIWSDIIDLEPIKKFAFGNVVLMGDAAHATTPNMGQGACMAIEDAVVLSNCLEDYASVEEAFVQFEKKRIGRTTKIVNGSWTLGRLAQLKNPLLMTLRDAAIRVTPESVAERQLKFLYDISFY